MIHIFGQGGRAWTFDGVPEINTAGFSAKEIQWIEFAGVTVDFGDNEAPIAHRMRKRLPMRTGKLEQCYRVLTTKRMVYFFEEGHVLSIPNVGDKHVLFRDMQLTPAELEYAATLDIEDCEVGQWLCSEIERHLISLVPNDQNEVITKELTT